MTAGGISLALPEFCTKFAKNLCKPQIDHFIGLAHISDRRRGRRLFRRRDVSDDYFQGTLHGVRDRREPAHESARHPLRFAATARGGGRVARRFLGGRRGVLRRKLLVLYGRLLRRTRSGRFPVGRRPARSGSATVPLRRLLFCPFVGRFWRKAASSRPVASVLAPVFVFYEVFRPGRRVWNAARAVATHEKLRRHPR